jgi:hypothetical protein
MYEKVTLSFTNSSGGGKFIADYSTKAFNGEIVGLYYSSDATNPLKSASSGKLRLREGSTIGNVLVASSSGVAGVARWMIPGRAVTYSSKVGTGSSGLHPGIPIVKSKLYLTCARPSSAAGKGSSEGCSVDVYIKGIWNG